MVAKTIWLTGSRGFVGRRVFSELKRAGHQVHSFTNVEGGSGKTVSGSTITLNYRDSSDIHRRLSELGLPDVFLHIGWGDMDKPESPYHLGENVPAARTLIETLFQAGLQKFLFVGSMNEYGARTGLLSEDMGPEGRLTNYAKAKIEVAKIGFESARIHNKMFLHVRTFYVYGAGQREGSLINDLYKAYCTGTETKLSPCEHFRDYVHVADVAEGLRRITEVEGSRTVNLGSGQVVEVKEFVKLLWRELGGDASKLKFGDRQVRADEPEQPKSYADLRGLKAATGWAPMITLEEGAKLTAQELKAGSGVG
jgi:nucleoside-diphosphate-sugar epimerase